MHYQGLLALPMSMDVSSMGRHEKQELVNLQYCSQKYSKMSSVIKNIQEIPRLSYPRQTAISDFNAESGFVI